MISATFLPFLAFLVALTCQHCSAAVRGPKNATVTLGQEASFSCECDGFDNRFQFITWRFTNYSSMYRGKPKVFEYVGTCNHFGTSPYNEIRSKTADPKIDISEYKTSTQACASEIYYSNVTFADAANMKIECSCSDEEYNSPAAYIRVVEHVRQQPKILNGPLILVEPNWNDTVVCQAESYPPMDFHWLINGIPYESPSITKVHRCKDRDDPTETGSCITETTLKVTWEDPEATVQCVGTHSSGPFSRVNYVADAIVRLVHPTDHMNLIPEPEVNADY